MTVKDPADLAWFVRHRLSTMLGQESTEILSEKKKHTSGNGHCAENHESHYQTRLETFKRQTGQCLAIPLKEYRRKKIKVPGWLLVHSIRL